MAERYLGVRDLVWQFDREKTEEVRWDQEHPGTKIWRVVRSKRGWKFGWAMALMEMLVDPVLLM